MARKKTKVTKETENFLPDVSLELHGEAKEEETMAEETAEEEVPVAAPIREEVTPEELARPMNGETVEECPREMTAFEKLTPHQLQELQAVANRFSFMKKGRGAGKLDQKMFDELGKEIGFLGMLSPDLLTLFK